jgi:transcriptional regulator with XRE-family HTH domain
MHPNERLKAVRSELGLSQLEMSKRLGIGQSYYSALERGEKSIQANLIEKLFNQLKVSTYWWYNSIGDIFIELSDAELEDSNRVADEAVDNLKRDKVFQYSNDISLKLYNKYYSDFVKLIDVLDVFWEKLAVILQFISQYDTFVINKHNPSLEAYAIAKRESLDEDQLKERLSLLFGNIKPIIPLLHYLNKSLDDNIKKLRPYDVENALERKELIEAQTALKNNDLGTLVPLEEIFNIVNKIYSDL